MTDITLSSTLLANLASGSGLTGVSADIDQVTIIDTSEAAFWVNDDGTTEVTMYDGTWPNEDVIPVGTLPDVFHAVRYVSWLLKRDAYYEEQATEVWESQFNK